MRRPLLCTLLVCVAYLSSANADTYVVPWDFEVVCLDLEKGTEVWRTTPRKLGTPDLFISGDALIAEAKGGFEGRGATRVAVHVRYSLNLGSGKATEASSKQLDSNPSVDVKPLEALDNLTDASGRKYLFRNGNTRHLEVESANGSTLVKKLDTYPGDLSVVGDTVFFTLAGYNGGGGEVFAYSPKNDRLEWEFDASKHIKKLSEHAYTFVTADESAVYVSVNQVLFALNRKTGAVLWKTALSRQSIRRYDAGWTTLAKHNGKLIVSVYEDLFVLRESDGKLLWSFDAGRFGKPWPVLHKGRLYVAARSGPVQRSSFSITNRAATKAKSALKIVRKGQRYSITVMSRRDIPKGKPVWWSLKQPAKSGSKSKKRRLNLELVDDDGDDIEIDLTSALRRRSSTTYVKFNGYFDRAILSSKEGELTSAEI